MENNKVTITLEGLTDKQLNIIRWRQEKKEKKEIKCWEDLECVSWFYVNELSKVCATSDCFSHTTIFNKRTRAYKEQAQASIAMAQLSQLLKHYNGWRQPDIIRRAKGRVGMESYTIIYFCQWKATIGTSCMSDYFLTFKTEEIAKKFFENHRDLIELAKPLL